MYIALFVWDIKKFFNSNYPVQNIARNATQRNAPVFAIVSGLKLWDKRCK